MLCTLQKFSKVVTIDIFIKQAAFKESVDKWMNSQVLSVQQYLQQGHCMRGRRQLDQSRYLNTNNNIIDTWVSLGRADRERQRDGYYYPYDRSHGVCNYCSAYHRNENDKCYFMCHYCHSVHLKSTINDRNKQDKINICPLLKSMALQQQSKKAYLCDQCGGYGFLEKVIQTTHYQPRQLYQQRLQEYEKQRSENQKNAIKPQRKVFKQSKDSNLEKCQRCTGRGKQYKMVYCCQKGCSDCGFSKMVVNYKWRQIRSKGQLNDQVFPCRICSEEVAVGDRIFKMHCGHTFHRSCIFSWLYQKEGQCYTCNEVDPYLEKEDIPAESLTKLIYIGNTFKKVEQNKKKIEAAKNKLAVLQKYDYNTENVRNSIQISRQVDSFISCQSRHTLPGQVEDACYQNQLPNRLPETSFGINPPVDEPENQSDSLILAFNPPSQNHQREELTLDLSIVQGPVVSPNRNGINNDGNREGQQSQKFELPLIRQPQAETNSQDSWELDQIWPYYNS